LVVLHPWRDNGKDNRVLLLDLKDKRWVRTKNECYLEDGDPVIKLNDWIDKQSNAKTLTRGTKYILMTPDGEVVAPFEVTATRSDPSGGKRYVVYWLYGEDGSSSSSPHQPYSTLSKRDVPLNDDHYSPKPDQGEEKYEFSRNHNHDEIVLGVNKGKYVINKDGALFMPVGTKMFVMSGYTNEDGPENVENKDKDSKTPLEPGDLVSLQVGIYKMASAVKIFNDGLETTINNARMSPKTALLTLVRDHGLTEDTAQNMLKEAHVHRGQTFYIKYAEPYPAQPLITAPPFPDPSTSRGGFFNGQLAPEQIPLERQLPVPGALRAPPDYDNMARPVEPQQLQAIQQAAGTGQKEIIDASMLTGMLRNNSDDMIIDREVKGLMKGLDASGRLLFNLYWHHDKFEDRYGEDLPELEDQLKSTFDSLGDVALKIKEKAVTNSEDMTMSSNEE
jgi:hypothetical protein